MTENMKIEEIRNANKKLSVLYGELNNEIRHLFKSAKTMNQNEFKAFKYDKSDFLRMAAGISERLQNDMENIIKEVDYNAKIFLRAKGKIRELRENIFLTRQSILAAGGIPVYDGSRIKSTDMEYIAEISDKLIKQKNQAIKIYLHAADYAIVNNDAARKKYILESGRAFAGNSPQDRNNKRVKFFSLRKVDGAGFLLLNRTGIYKDIISSFIRCLKNIEELCTQLAERIYAINNSGGFPAYGNVFIEKAADFIDYIYISDIYDEFDEKLNGMMQLFCDEVNVFKKEMIRHL